MKWSGGGAGSYLAYIDDEEGQLKEESSDKARRYYAGIDTGDVVFPHIGGKGIDNLPGLDRSRGLTKDQHADLHRGHWNGEELVPVGHRRVWEKDARGHDVWMENPDTGKFERVPVMVQAVTRTGRPRVDSEGNPIMRQKTEAVHTAGHDLPFSFSKGIVEFLAQHPEWRDVVAECGVAAVDTALRLGVEDGLATVKERVATPTEVGPRHNRMQGSQTHLVQSDGLIWALTPQFGTRPSPETDVRLGDHGVPDPLFHVHAFLFGVGRLGDGWKAPDFQHVWRNMLHIADIADVEFTRLLQEAGVPFEFDGTDRKGYVVHEVAGSNAELRRFLSTGEARAWRIRMAYEREHGKPMSKIELEQAMQRTKGKKTAAAREADAGGPEYWAKVKAAVDEEWERTRWDEKTQSWVPVHKGPAWTVEAPGAPYEHGEVGDRLVTLYDRLEAPEGLMRDVELKASFPEKVIRPTVMRSGVGLGFSAEQLLMIADDYRDNHLQQVVTQEGDLEYVTQTVLDAERDNAEWLERLAGRRCDEVPEEILARMVAKHGLDDGQEKALRLACSSKSLTYIIGPAGAGKTTLLQAIAEALREATVIRDLTATATAGRRGVATGSDVNAEHMGSIQSIASKVKNRRWVPSSRDAMFLDEGSLTSTLDLKALRLAASGVGRVIVVLDPKQLQAIGPSGWQNEELRKRPEHTAELEKVYRQQDVADRDAFLMIRDGYAHAAIADLHERGRIHVAEDTQGKFALFNERYALHREAGRSVEEVVMYVQGSNRDALDVYNRMVQRYRMAAHERGEDDGFDPSAFVKVYESSTGRRWTLFKGDRVVFARGYWDGFHQPVRTGESGELLRVERDGSLRVRFDNKRELTVRIDPNATEQRVVPGYAISTTRGQGSQATVAMVDPGEPGTTSLNSFYTQVSRAVEHVDVLVDKDVWGAEPLQRLGMAASIPEEKISAASMLHYMDDPDEVELQTVWDFHEEDGILYASLADDLDIEESEATEKDDALDYLTVLRQTLREKTEIEEPTLDDPSIDNSDGWSIGL